MSLIESIGIIEKSADKLEKIQELVGEIVENKFANKIEKSSGFHTVKMFRHNLIGKNHLGSLNIEFTPDIFNIMRLSHMLTQRHLLVNTRIFSDLTVAIFHL